MNILRESMTKVVILPWIVRVWRQEEGSVVVSNDDIQRKARELRYEAHGETTCYDIALELLKLPRVNAVEVLAEEGQGEVLYRCDEVMIGDKRLTII